VKNGVFVMCQCVVGGHHTTTALSSLCERVFAGSQKSATHPRAETGAVHPVGSGQYTGGTVAQVSVRPDGSSRQRTDACQSHKHLIGWSIGHYV
jgi:hypothetical protein